MIMRKIDFRTAIRHILDKYQISQKKLAEAIMKTGGAVSQMLSGKSEIRIETQRLLINGLAREKIWH